ncbi:MAG: hypothetical protein KF703_06385, partial [Actinobacteria bacterium]|nr:hypothetical protein [Actinomycetota bacterium]
MLDVALGVAGVLGLVESVLARVAAALGVRSLHSCDQVRSVPSWLAGRTELSHGRAKALVTTGRGLAACPLVEAAYAEGRLGSPKVEAMIEVREGVE